jgi:hypothetical protein
MVTKYAKQVGKKLRIWQEEEILPDHLLGLVFYPEDGGSMFLRNVMEHLPDYFASSYKILIVFIIVFKVNNSQFTPEIFKMWDSPS